jgi:hypothetical protein
MKRAGTIISSALHELLHLSISLMAHP